MRVCVERGCGSEFLLEPNELRWYELHQLEPPKRCRECRARRRTERQQTTDVAQFWRGELRR